MSLVFFIILLTSCATTPDIHSKIPGTNLEINQPAELAERLAVSPKNNLVLVGSIRHTSTLWDVTTGQRLKSFRPSSDIRAYGAGVGVKVLPDGMKAVTYERSINIWELETGKELKASSLAAGDMATLRRRSLSISARIIQCTC